MTDLLPLARIGVYSTDLGFYLTIGIYLGIIHWLTWYIARYTDDIELWKTGAFCLLVGSMTILGVGMGGIGGILSAAILGLLGGWIVLGYVFELETWQRAVITAVGPPAAVGSFLAGYWLKGLILTNIIK